MGVRAATPGKQALPPGTAELLQPKVVLDYINDVQFLKVLNGDQIFERKEGKVHSTHTYMVTECVEQNANGFKRLRRKSTEKET